MADPFLDNVRFSFSNIEVSNEGIPTDKFLEATEDEIINIIDKLGAAFTVVKNDMTGNVKKVRDRFLSNPIQNETLESLLLNEKNEKKRGSTEGLLWLIRGLQFTAVALLYNINNSGEELNVSFTRSYEETLKKFHSFAVKPVFALAMKACPYRKVFYEKLVIPDDPSNERMMKLKETIESLDKIVKHMLSVLSDPLKANIKGM